MQQDFTRSDAWLLVAAMIAERPTDLGRLVAAADGIDHSIPTGKEVSGAFNRLTAAGLLSLAGGEIRLTPRAEALHGQLRGERRSVPQMVDHVHRALRELGPQEAAEVHSCTDAELGSAYDTYRQRLK